LREKSGRKFEPPYVGCYRNWGGMFSGVLSDYKNSYGDYFRSPTKFQVGQPLSYLQSMMGATVRYKNVKTPGRDKNF